jgi:hypothetical protein
MENLGTSKVQSFFVWLILRERVWTADRLQRRGWPNCGDCQLFMLKPESMVHLLFKCRYSLTIWNYIISWPGLDSTDISLWVNFDTVEEWCLSFIYLNCSRRKSVASLIVLISWEIWNKCYVRVFCSVSSLPNMVVTKVNTDVELWHMAGARHLVLIMPRG